MRDARVCMSKLSCCKSPARHETRAPLQGLGKISPYRSHAKACPPVIAA
jgi:hypothetical protein